MGLFTTKSCLFCLSLRTGGFALGILALLHGIIGTVYVFYRYEIGNWKQQYEYGPNLTAYGRKYVASCIGTNQKAFSQIKKNCNEIV